MGPELGKILMVVGGVLLSVGAVLALNLFPWLGRLPGDIVWRKDNFTFYFPLATGLLISLIVTLILNFFKRH